MLEDWGWDQRWADCLAELGGAAGNVARVTGQTRDRWSIQTENGPGVARLASSRRLGTFPVVGDWVIVEDGPEESDPYSIRAVLPRRSALSRGSPHTGTAEQVLASNVDVGWIVHGLDAPLNPRRMERYLALVWESGAVPEIVLTKADLVEDSSATAARAARLAPGVAVRTVSTAESASVAELRGTIRPRSVMALLGPSGVGKSSLVNALAERDVAEVGEVRVRDRKGRHTTTRRQLYPIPGGGLLLDTPGIRELRVWDLEEGLQHTFPEIDDLAVRCRFRDCTHESEPGCAVLEARERGALDGERLASFRKLRAEAAYQARKADPLAREAAVSEFKTAMKTLKRHHPKYRRD